MQSQTVPQLLHIALATALLVTCGQGVRDIFAMTHGQFDEEAIVRLCYLGAIALWATAIFIDDHHFYRSVSGHLHAGYDTVFLVVAWLAMISAVSSIAYIETTHFIMIVYFAITALWGLVDLTVNRHVKRVKEIDDGYEIQPMTEEEVRKIVIWVAVDLALICAFCVAISIGAQGYELLPFAAALFLATVLNVFLCNTLSSKNLLG